MSLIYQIVFPQDAPKAESLVQQIATKWGPTITIVHEIEDQLLILQNSEWLLSLTTAKETGLFELSFGEYRYLTDWYIELGKADGLAAMRFYMELIQKLVNEFSYDFMSIFNGERVVLKKELGQLYLNTESSLWQKPENLVLLGNQQYSLATYPVNY